jgi:phenylacetate-CoA ligase
MTMKRILFDLKYRLYRPQAYTYYDKLIKSQYWNLEQIHDFQLLKKRELVEYAFQNLSFYRSLYGDAGFRKGDSSQNGYFERLPILTKNHLRSSFEGILNKNLKKYSSVSTTGGSTGVPIKVIHDSRFPYESFNWRMLNWWGLHPGDGGGYVWRNPRLPKADLINKFMWWPTEKLRIDASSITEDHISSFLLKFNSRRLPLLQGYVGAIDEIASWINKNNKEIYSPIMIWLTAAPISKVQREKIEKAFHAPVCDQYGSCEIPNIAAQCTQQHGLHVNTEGVVIEFLDIKSNKVTTDQWGKMLITDLNNYLFPLIRYENGDIGRWLGQQCHCGRTLPLIDSVKGRVSEIIKLPSGRYLSGEYLTTIFDAHPNIVLSFRVIQKKNKSLVVEFVPVNYDQDKNLFYDLLKSIEKKVDNEVSVIFKPVENIPHDRGKLRYIVCE